MKNTVFILVSALIIMASVFIAPQYQVAHKTDYEHYLSPDHLRKSRQELASRIAFWEQKLQAAPGNFVYQEKLAGLYASGFKLSGDINQLHRSDSLLRAINNRLPGRVGVLQSLAANAITRHAFREAEGYIREAYGIGENRFSSSLMLADVALERGNRLEATLLLDGIAPGTRFDYLIREAKLHDQSDDLDKAVRSMEKAAALAKTSGSPPTINWALSNLGDMYGHQGRIKKSYTTYLEALRYNRSDLHSLKGIAWIAFSHDRNPEEAKRIVSFLQSIHLVPDYHLLLAEIAAYEKDAAAEEQHKEWFMREASRPAYGNMYKSYICHIKSEREEAREALEIAREEVRERPHPMSYHLLAWAAYRSGYSAQALEILERHVIGQTGEPEALYHAGVILKETGRKEAARVHFQAAQEASFELGPVTAAAIGKHLEQL
ncbi:MAG: hypothetical protein J5I98_16100 [Phaeodactylibacter sp.]|nr:hypothetical protein [Phaeodactylibacter sp.]